jgi:uncharacterized protein YbjT (DUF2867 family)
VRLAKLPVIPVPAGFVVQPVNSGEVATRLAELALEEPRGRAPDMAGPQILSFANMIRMYLSATGRRPRPVVAVWTPGIGPIRAGALYPRPEAEATLGHRTWPDFLAEQQTTEQQPGKQQTGKQQSAEHQSAEHQSAEQQPGKQQPGKQQPGKQQPAEQQKDAG